MIDAVVVKVSVGVRLFGVCRALHEHRQLPDRMGRDACLTVLSGTTAGDSSSPARYRLASTPLHGRSCVSAQASGSCLAMMRREASSQSFRYLAGFSARRKRVMEICAAPVSRAMSTAPCGSWLLRGSGQCGSGGGCRPGQIHERSNPCCKCNHRSATNRRRGAWRHRSGCP